MSLNTAGWCHSTPADSGTSPSIRRDIRFTNAPNSPVISAEGTRAPPMVSPSHVVFLSSGMETPAGESV
ncbi:hypothetical protein JCM33774_22900 [Actinophytocola sp. KF-1]